MMSVQTPLRDAMDKENVGPAGKPVRALHLGSVGRKILGRRDNTLPQDCLSIQKVMWTINTT